MNKKLSLFAITVILGINSVCADYAKDTDAKIVQLQKALALKPTDTNSLNSLAKLYYAQGKYAEAEPLFIKSLALREKALGENHPEVALSLNNLAELYRTIGDYEQAGSVPIVLA